MICPGCRDMVPEGNPFCHLCGAKLTDSQESGSLRERRLEKIDRIVERRQTQGSTARPPVASVASRYSGASLVAGTLSVIGWIIAIGGIILGGILASEYEPGPFEENVGTTRLLIFVGTALGGWLYAMLVLWMAYALRLLSDIERNTVRRGGSGG